MVVVARAAVPLRLAHAALVVGEDGDALLDEGSHDVAVAEPRLLAGPVNPDDGGMAAVRGRQVERPRELGALAREVDGHLLVVAEICGVAEGRSRVRAAGRGRIRRRGAAARPRRGEVRSPPPGPPTLCASARAYSSASRAPSVAAGTARTDGQDRRRPDVRPLRSGRGGIDAPASASREPRAGGTRPLPARAHLRPVLAARGSAGLAPVPRPRSARAALLRRRDSRGAARGARPGSAAGRQGAVRLPGDRRARGRRGVRVRGGRPGRARLGPAAPASGGAPARRSRADRGPRPAPLARERPYRLGRALRDDPSRGGGPVLVRGVAHRRQAGRDPL